MSTELELPPPPPHPLLDRVPRIHAVSYTADSLSVNVHQVRDVRVDDYGNGYSLTFLTADGTRCRVDIFGDGLPVPAI